MGVFVEWMGIRDFFGGQGGGGGKREGWVCFEMGGVGSVGLMYFGTRLPFLFSFFFDGGMDDIGVRLVFWELIFLGGWGGGGGG